MTVSGSGETLAFDLVTRDHGATKGMRSFGDEVARTGRKMGGAASDAAGLTAEIDRTAVRVRDLEEELARTGDRGLLRDLGKEKRVLAGLAKARQEMAGLAAETSNVSRLSTGLLGAFGPVGSTLVVGGIVAGIVAASPLIGGAVAAAVLAGLGGGVLAAGIASAVQDHRVAAAFKPLADDAKDLFADVGEFFKRPLVGAVGPLRGALADIRADAILAGLSISKVVEPLAKGVRGFLAAAFGGGGFLKAVREAEPVLRELGLQLPKIGRAVDDMFASFADAGPGAVEGMRLLSAIIQGTLMLVGELTEKLSKTLNVLTDIAADAPAALGPLGLLLGSINGPAAAAEEGVRGFGSAADTAADEVRRLNGELDTLIGNQLSLDEAQVRAAQSMLTLRGELAEIGKSSDSAAAKQLAGEAALLRVVRAHDQVRQAAIDQAGGTSQAAVIANAAFEKQIGKIRELAVAAGLSARQVDAILAPYLRLLKAPNISKTIEFFGRVRFTTAGAPPGTAGTYTAFAQGGVVAAQTGLVHSGVVDQPTVLFGERGTGGEAFIARNAPRGRSLAIGAQAMAWHGAAVVPREATRGAAQEVRFIFEGRGDDLLQAIVRELRRLVRVDGGGNVQAALGT